MIDIQTDLILISLKTARYTRRETRPERRERMKRRDVWTEKKASVKIEVTGLMEKAPNM